MTDQHPIDDDPRLDILYEPKNMALLIAYSRADEDRLKAFLRKRLLPGSRTIESIVSAYKTSEAPHEGVIHMMEQVNSLRELFEGKDADLLNMYRYREQMELDENTRTLAELCHETWQFFGEIDEYADVLYGMELGILSAIRQFAGEQMISPDELLRDQGYCDEIERMVVPNASEALKYTEMGLAIMTGMTRLLNRYIEYILPSTVDNPEAGVELRKSPTNTDVGKFTQAIREYRTEEAKRIYRFL